MNPEFNFQLTSNLPITQFFNTLGINDFVGASKYVHVLPYKRNKNKEDFFCVITDQFGTCSTKHALLKRLAIENRNEQVKLVMGIFKMNAEKTPRLQTILDRSHLKYIPEAHIYLMVDNQYLDFTGAGFSLQNIRSDIMFELEILPEEITTFKVSFHRELLEKWLTEQSYLKINIDELWAIREECILELSAW